MGEIIEFFKSILAVLIVDLIIIGLLMKYTNGKIAVKWFYLFFSIIGISLISFITRTFVDLTVIVQTIFGTQMLTATIYLISRYKKEVKQVNDE